jgi:tetratricopeptide (TPR) repeat protein
MAAARWRASAEPDRDVRALRWLPPLAVAATTFVAFLPVLRAGFVNIDDDRVLLNNPYLRLPWPDAWRWMWTTTYIGHYQPLAWMSLKLDATMSGLAPLAFHLDSLLWHVAAALALYAVLAALLAVAPATRAASLAARRAAAAAGALFWSIHPLRVESVAWVAERRDPISATFWLLALLAYMKHATTEDAEDRRRGQRRLYVASCVLLAISLLAKSWGMTFVVTLIALDWYPLRRLAWAEKLPFALIGGAAGLLAWIAQHNQPDTMVSLARWSAGDRLLQAGYGLWFYVWKTLWPTSLAVLYPLPASLPASFWIALVAAVVAGAALLWRARAHPAVAAAALAYAATVAPVLGVAQSGPQLVADRYAYLAAIPFSALLAGAAALLFAAFSGRPIAAAVLSQGGREDGGKVVGRIAAGMLAAVLVLFGMLTWRQAGVWRNSLTLWAHAIETGHPSSVAHLDYGQALRASGRLGEAIAQYQRAVALNPTSGSAWYNLANGLKAINRPKEAERAYELAIQYLPWKVDAQVNLGNLYFSQGRVPEAAAQYRAATATLDHVPPAEFTPGPYLYLGIALADSGDRAGALQALSTARRYQATRARAEREIARVQASGAAPR